MIREYNLGVVKTDYNAEIANLARNKRFFIETTTAIDGKLVGVKYDESSLTDKEKQDIKAYLQSKGFTV